jgi:hypothetical protein
VHVPPPPTFVAPWTLKATDPVGRAGDPPARAPTDAVQVVDAPGATVPGAQSTAMLTGGPGMTDRGVAPVDAARRASPPYAAETCFDPNAFGVSGTAQLAVAPAPDSMHVEVVPNDPAVPEKLTVPDGGPTPAPSWSVTVAEHVVGTPNPAGLGMHVTATDVGRGVTDAPFWNS